jgi:hypothetical protein
VTGNFQYNAIAGSNNCGAIDQIVRFGSTFADEEQCTAAKATYGTYCGCDNPVADAKACRLCGSDSLLFDPTLGVSFDDGSTSTCLFQEYTASLRMFSDTEICSTYQGAFDDICCARELQCPGICQDGSAVGNPDQLVQDGVTCTDLQESLKEKATSSYDCTDAVKYQVICGCPANVTIACHLCEDGSDAPDSAFLVDPVANLTCGRAFEEYALLEGDKCVAAQRTYGTYCGCNNPVVNEGACRSCGDSILLPDLSKVQRSTRTCIAGEFLRNQYAGSCTDFQQSNSFNCCDGSDLSNSTIVETISNDSLTLGTFARLANLTGQLSAFSALTVCPDRCSN